MYRLFCGLSVVVLLLTGVLRADTWSDGQMLTYSQDAWAGVPSPSTATSLLTDNMSTVYAANFGALVVGLTAGGFSMTFTNASAVTNYLPAGGALGPLDANLSNPTLSSSGAFGGDVVTLALNVDFSNAGYISGSTGYSFGNLVLTGFDAPDTTYGIPALPALDGLTVAQFLGITNTLLGGGSVSSGYSIADVDPVAVRLSDSFLVGVPSLFAEDHLLPPGSGGTDLSTVPEPSSLIVLVGACLLALSRRQLTPARRRR